MLKVVMMFVEDEDDEGDIVDAWTYKTGEGPYEEKHLADFVRGDLDVLFSDFGGYTFSDSEPFGKH